MVDAPNLGIKVTSNGRTSSHIGFHDIADYLDRFAVLQARRIYVCLAYNCIPLDMIVSFDQQRTNILTAWLGYDIRS